MAEQDYEIWSVTVPYLSAGDLMNIYFDSAQHPDAEPDELEGRRDRRVAEARPLRADRGRPRQILRAGAAEGDARASLDAGAQHQHAPGRQQEDQGRAAAHDLPEHVLQGAGRVALEQSNKEQTMRGLFDDSCSAAGVAAASRRSRRRR